MDPARWASESHRLPIQYAYAILKDGQLGEDYFGRCVPVVDQQLQTAGVRLAAMLNTIFDAVKCLPTSAPAAMTPAGKKPSKFIGSRRSQATILAARS